MAYQEININGLFFEDKQNSVDDFGSSFNGLFFEDKQNSVDDFGSSFNGLFFECDELTDNAFFAFSGL